MPYQKINITTTKKKPKSFELSFLKFGAGTEIRTRHPNLGRVVLYQLGYSRLFMCAYYNEILIKVKQIF